MKKTWMLAIGWLLSLGVNAQELKYPYIDALDAEHWNGLVAVESPDKAFAMRFNHFLEISKGLRYIERGGWDFQQSVSDVGHKASDGLYAEVSWKVKGVPATLSWSRIDEETVVGKLKCGDTKGRKFGVWLEFYAPWLYESTYALCIQGWKSFFSEF